MVNNLKQKNLQFNNKNDEIKLNDYLIAYAENMSYIRTNSVEIIICTFMLSCVEDIEIVLDEIYRILKPVSLFFFWKKNNFCLFIF